MKSEPVLSFACRIPESLRVSIDALMHQSGLNVAQWLSNDPRVVAYRAAENIPEPVFPVMGRPRKKRPLHKWEQAVADGQGHSKV